jgi:general secretion pathway protein D
VHRLLLAACVLSLCWLAGCAKQTEDPGADLRSLPLKPPEPIGSASPNRLIAGGARQSSVRAGPSPPGAPPTPARAEATVALSGPSATLTIEQMPLPAFINTVFGETLHLNFEIDPRIAQRTDVVTLRTGRALPPGEILTLTRSILRDYGIQVTLAGDLARIVPNEALLSQVPAIIRGRSTAEIAENLRPLFEYTPVGNIAATEMAAWLQAAFGAKLKITPAANALILLGLPEDVAAANEAIHTLDQPRLAGRRSLRIEPAFWSASQLADRLADILRAEGYNVSTSLQNAAAIVILSLRPSNSLVVFASDQKTLSHVEEWSRDLDKVSKADPQKSLFYYGVRNTTAESIAGILNAVLQGNASGRAAANGPSVQEPASSGTPGQSGSQLGAAAPTPSVGLSAASASGPPPGTPPPGRIVTDPARNAIIFQGSAEEFGQLRPLLENLDQAAREAIIEVTVAEITLSSDDKLGVEGILKFSGFGQPHQVISTLGGTGIGTSGLNYTILNAGGATRAVLNAFASDNRVKVLSTPKLLSRSGGEARIQVGAQVPIVTSQGTSSQLQTQGTSAILQSIQYRDTGVILTLKPTIYAGNQVNLDIKQEVSEAVQNNTSGLSTPVINNRTISTQLSLHDGNTVLIGGLIAENVSSTDTGVPFLKDVPGVGYLFGTQEVTKRRSELFVFITPYIVNSTEEAARMTDLFKRRYESLPQPESTLHW